MAIHPIGLCREGLTTTGVGPDVLLRGERIEYGATNSSRRLSFPFDVNLTASGAAASTATVQVEYSYKNQTVSSTIAGVSTTTPVLVAAPGAPVTAAITTVGGGMTASLQSSPDGTTWTNVPSWTALTAITAAAVVTVAGALQYRWNITAYTSGSPVVTLSDWVMHGTAWSVTIPASGAPQMMSDAPMLFRLGSYYDYVRVNVTAISGATIQGWLKRRE